VRQSQKFNRSTPLRHGTGTKLEVMKMRRFESVRERNLSMRHCYRLVVKCILIVVGIAVGFLPELASATCQYNAGTGPATIRIVVPTTLSIPRDAANGKVVYTSNPVAPPTQVSFGCSGDSIGIKNIVGTQPATTTNLFPIGTTGLSFQWIYQGVGEGAFGVGTLNANTGFAGTTHAFRLVKTGPIAANAVVPAGNVATFSYGTLNPLTMSLSNQISIVALSCITPDVTVTMGSYNAAAFTGTGSATKPVGFNVAVNNCPAGMTTIQYQFSAPGGVTDATNGVIALTSSASTATGVGLKLMDSTSAALKFGTQYQVTGYNTATGGSYTIPLLAAYSQTGATVTPGTANAVMTFTMTYQ
jgi:major type 1 subunit fimbrin (pilin)